MPAGRRGGDLQVVLLHVLRTLSAIIVLRRALRCALEPLGQPQVIGDILADIMPLMALATTIATVPVLRLFGARA